MKIKRRTWNRRFGCLALSLGLLVCAAEGGKKVPLTAAIEVPSGQTDTRVFRIKLRITNPNSHRVAILNPDMGVPAPGSKWPFSQEVYQTSMLISFGYLSMAVTDPNGKEVPQQAIQAWATPVLRPPIELKPGDSVELAIPIGSFCELASGKTYQVAVTYGDKEVKVSARGSMTVS